MTAKEVIKARCRDCSGRECGFTDCALKGLAKSKREANRTAAIRKYCQWCMNKNPVSQCASPNCAIYQYRSRPGINLHVMFLPVKTPIGVVPEYPNEKPLKTPR
jgi:hypothetical protein